MTIHPFRLIIESNETHYKSQDLSDFADRLVFRAQQEGSAFWSYPKQPEFPVQVIYYKTRKSDRTVKMSEAYELQHSRLSFVRPNELGRTAMEVFAVQNTKIVPLRFYQDYAERLFGLIGLSTPWRPDGGHPVYLDLVDELLASGQQIQILDEPQLDKKTADHIRTVTNLTVKHQSLSYRIRSEAGSLFGALRSYRNTERSLEATIHKLSQKGVHVETDSLENSKASVKGLLQEYMDSANNMTAGEDDADNND